MAQHEVVFPMPGKVISVEVAVGDSVDEDDTLAVFEAMKIEMPLASTAAGKVAEIKASAEQMVEAEQVFCIIED
jgi:biotin carboxyl carrier protein